MNPKRFNPDTLDTFPTLPGVYIMKGQEGQVLYVGKANVLRQRVKQYFVPGRDGRVMVPFLIAKVQEIETIVVHSEKEALLLENTLIKQHRPRYNALLKDDKTYTALKLCKHTWPSLRLVRLKGKPKADGIYFGPYTSAHSARATLEVLQHLFPLRQCTDQEFNRRTRPCILYDMKRCPAPCVGKCTKEEYQHSVERTVQFLRGQDRDIIISLQQEMEKAAEALEFEVAAQILRTLRQIEETLEVQGVERASGGEAFDALGLYRHGNEAVICQLFFREGKLIGSKVHPFRQVIEDDDELITTFLLQQYDREGSRPKEILLPFKLNDSSAIEDILAAENRRRITLSIPQKGEKKAHVDMAHLNAESSLKRERNEESLREQLLLEMQERFHLKAYPRRIECIDTSNLGGQGTVSALIAWTDGKKDSSRYRKYRIREAEAGDDYGALREVLQRRFRKASMEEDLPDLLLIDGGKGHLNAALSILQGLNVVTVDVIGIAKEAGRHDKGLTNEQIFLPGAKDPLFLRQTSPLLLLLQQIRDEAHRVAITYQKSVRSKGVIKSALDDVPGVGPSRRKALLKHFGSLAKLKAATVAELTQVKGVSTALAEIVLNHFLKKPTAPQ